MGATTTVAPTLLTYAIQVFERFVFGPITPAEFLKNFTGQRDSLGDNSMKNHKELQLRYSSIEIVTLCRKRPLRLPRCSGYVTIGLRGRHEE